MRCGKVMFTEKKARAALHKALNSYSTNRKEKRIYYCSLCKMWHLTSDDYAGEMKKVKLSFKEQWKEFLNNQK